MKKVTLFTFSLEWVFHGCCAHIACGGFLGLSLWLLSLIQPTDNEWLLCITYIRDPHPHACSDHTLAVILAAVIKGVLAVSE